MRFIGRKKELESLNDLWQKKSASLVVIKGRRRIGKSRLAEEFAKNHTFITITGIPPNALTTAQSQRNAFAKQLKKTYNESFSDEDWWDILWYLADKTKQGKIVILLDEISWMGSKDPDFLGKFKSVWDVHFKKNPNIIIIMCGSVSAWIEKNILSNTGFLGRISLTLTLKELPIQDCNLFWNDPQNMISAYEKLKILSVTGGIPRYLEEIKPHLSAEENIRKMCFINSGILFTEFEQIFSDLFSSRNEIYKHIVHAIADARADRNQIAHQLNIEAGGTLSEYLDDLLKAGFLTRDFSWRIEDGKTSKLSHFRLSDNYLRFYLKYILPHKDTIEKGVYSNRSLTSLPGWTTIMGLQFENLVLNNRPHLHRLLGIHPEDIVAEGAYFQRKTEKLAGCQIDYLIQTKYDTLYVCEIRFSRHPVGPEAISDVKEKINRLKKPRYVSCRPVLIHVNGVHEDVEEADYFSNIIGFSDFLHAG